MARIHPAEYFKGLHLMPTSLSSEELTRLDPIIRQRCFFSAHVEAEKFLDGLRAFVQECAATGCTEGEFLHRVRTWLREHKDILGDDFPDEETRLQEMTPKEQRAYERSVRHIDSLARLRLIYRTQAEMCAGWNQYRLDMEPRALAMYPGWQFYRRPGAKTFRKDHVEHEGAIRLKTDVQFWLDRNSADQGGFELPYPPFGFNSWMWVRPVSRGECVRLGLCSYKDAIELPDDLRKKYGLDEEHAIEVIKRMLDKLCKYPQEPAEAPTRPDKVPPAVDVQPQGEKPAKAPQKPAEGTEKNRVTVPPFKEAKTIKDAVEYAQSAGVKYCGYKGVDVGVANDMNRSLAYHFSHFPELQDRVRFYGTHSGFKAAYKERVMQYYTARINSLGIKLSESELEASVKKRTSAYFRAPSRALAYSFDHVQVFKDADYMGICAVDSAKTVKKLDTFNASAKYMERIEESPAGCGTAKSVFDHEFAHQLDYLLDLRNNAALKAVYKKATRENLSRYGTTNVQEMIAEAWSEYLNNPTPRPLAKEVGDIIMAEYQKRFKK